MSEERIVEISEIKTDDTWMVRDKIDWDYVNELSEQIEEVLAKSPIELFDTPQGLYRVDGLHRQLAAQKKLLERVNAKVWKGTLAEAESYACVANLFHGKPLSREERQRAIDKYIGLNRDKSDAVLAACLGVHSVTVGRYRKQLEQCGKIEEVAERVGLDSRVRDVSKITSVHTSTPANVGVDEHPKLQKPTITPIQAAINPEDFILCAGCMSKVHKDRAVPLSKDDPEHFVHPTEHCRDLAKEKLKHAFKPQPPKEEKPPETKPRDFLSWRDREAQMHPHDSKFQLAVIQELQKEGLDIQTGIKFDVIISKVTMEPDGVWRIGDGKTAFIFIDGPPHLGHEDEDAELRNLLKEQHGGEICPIPYKADTQQERERAKQEVKDFPKWM